MWLPCCLAFAEMITDRVPAPAAAVTRVVHCKREAYNLYIGRPSKWGNPFVMGRDGSREEVIRKHLLHVLSRPDLLRALGGLRGKTLGCWCKPKPCHGDTLAWLADRFDAVLPLLADRFDTTLPALAPHLADVLDDLSMRMTADGVAPAQTQVPALLAGDRVELWGIQATVGNACRLLPGWHQPFSAQQSTVIYPAPAGNHNPTQELEV